MKFFGKFLAGVALVATLAGAAACGGTPKDSTGSAEVTVGTFKKDLYFENWSAFSVKNENHSYARIVEADDGTLIATGEDEKNGLRIYRSTDQGKTFTENATKVHDPNWEGFVYDAKWQPTLYVLPQDVGTELKKGDVLLVATSIDGGADNFTRNEIHLYISKDVGLTWSHLSKVQESQNKAQSGGTQNGCWEGNLFVNASGELACIFADETEHNVHQQRIVYKTTTDGVNWSELVEVVALNERDLRPGMPCVTRVKDGKYFLTIEMVGESDVPIYWKMSDDGIDWGDITTKGNRISVQEKVIDHLTQKEVTATVSPGASPFCAWTSYGKDDNGTVFVTSMDTHWKNGTPENAPGNDFFVSYDLGQSWERINHPVTYSNKMDVNRPAYSPSMCVSQDGEYLYVVNSIIPDASVIDDNIKNNEKNLLVFAKVDFSKSLQALKK